MLFRSVENVPASLIFYVEISGGIKLQGLGFTDEPIIDIRGGLKLEMGLFTTADGGTKGRFTLDASGTIKVIKLGNIGSAAARFVFEAGDTASGKPEFWGVAKIQANLDFLKNYGIFVEGSALLQINTTPTTKTEKISLEGVPGDTLKKDISLDVSALSARVLGDVDLPESWLTPLAEIDADPNTDGVQPLVPAGGSAIVRTIILGQQWKIITKTSDGKFGASYFVRFDTATDTYKIQSEKIGRAHV